MATSKEQGSVKKTLWIVGIFTALAAVIVAVVKVLFLDPRSRYTPNFTKTDDPTVVIDHDGDKVKLPDTKTEGQVTSNKVVAVEKVQTGGSVEVKNEKVPDSGAPIAGSAGEFLFGKRN